MSQSDTSGHTLGTIGPAIIVALIAGTLVAGMLSYTVKRHDVVHAQAAMQASEKIAVAVSQQFAELGGDIMSSDLYRLQIILEKGFPGTTLVSAMVIDPDNMVVAANPKYMIGQEMKDASWPSMRAQDKEIVSRTVAQRNQETLLVVEPLKEKGGTMAWAYLVFTLPPAEEFMMTSADRWIETARLVVPIAALLLITVWWVLRSSAVAIRKEVAQGLVSVREGKSAGESAARLKKAS
jgi:hypothetical protein